MRNTAGWCPYICCRTRVVVVDRIDHAIALARNTGILSRIVTLDGELLSPGGSMTGGAFRTAICWGGAAVG